MEKIIPMIIHDVNRTDRMIKLKEELRIQKIDDVIYMPAVFMNPTMDGIANAHKNCIKHAMAFDWDYCVIMEDDVKFTRENAYNDFIKLVNKYNGQFDVFLSGAYQMQILTSGPEIFLIRGFSGLHCYAVAKSYYETFLSCPNSVHIDRWLGIPKGGKANTLVANPFLAYQYPGFSDNVKKNIDWTNMVKKYLPKNHF